MLIQEVYSRTDLGQIQDQIYRVRVKMSVSESAGIDGEEMKNGPDLGHEM